MPALQRPIDDVALAVAAHGALPLGIAATALAHAAVGPTSQFGQTGAHQWTSTYSVNNVAPLVAAAVGFHAGQRDGARAAVGGFAGAAAGYLLLFLGTYALNGTLLDATQAGVRPVVPAGDAAGMGATAALFAVVAARWG